MTDYEPERLYVISDVINWLAWQMYPLADVTRIVTAWCDSRFREGWSITRTVIGHSNYMEVCGKVKATVLPAPNAEFAAHMLERRTSIEMALDGLGYTAKDVAKVLAAGGFSGRRSSHCECPIANYLRHELGAVAVTAMPKYIQVDGASYAPPSYVNAFMKRFDAGAFGDLVEMSA